MNKISRAVLLGIFVAGSTLAQDTLSGRAPNQNSSASIERFKYELILHQLEADHAQAPVEVAKRREAQYRERQFVDRLNKFVRTWSRFVSLYNERKAFDIKTAKELSKAFHELENCGDWPVLDRK
jgi:hypothetical protein